MRQRGKLLMPFLIYYVLTIISSTIAYSLMGLVAVVIVGLCGGSDYVADSVHTYLGVAAAMAVSYFLYEWSVRALAFPRLVEESKEQELQDQNPQEQGEP